MAKLVFRYYPYQVTPEEEQLEKKIFKLSLIIPFLFLIIIWLVKISETVSGLSFAEFGMVPRTIKGIRGILLSPLIHSDFKHLVANSTSFFVLAAALFFFYRKVALKVFIINYFMAGLLLWLGGREAIHIGASGIIYGMAAFLFLSGVLMKDLRLLTISLIVVFMYGSMIWGLFPFDPHVSWDGHVMGAVSGTVLSLLYYKQGPPVKTFEEDDEEDDEVPEDGNQDMHESNSEYHSNLN